MHGARCMVKGNTTSYFKPAHRIQHPVPSTGRFLNLFSYISFLFIFLHPLSFPAQMAKLVDALVSGTSVSNDVQVRVLFWAQTHLRPDGEIGRHASLRGWCRLRCASSSLVLGTNKKPDCDLQSGFFVLITPDFISNLYYVYSIIDYL